MKYLITIPLLCLATLFQTGCSEKGEGAPGGDPVVLEGLRVTLDDLTSDEKTRALGDYSVNTSLDPTFGMTDRTGWDMNLTLFNGDTVYVDGQSDFIWNSANNRWEPSVPVYFPNYTRKEVTVTLVPLGYSGTPATDQSTAELLLAQDPLVQNGVPSVTIMPAHVPNISLRHENSMIDFIIQEAEASQIEELFVMVGNTRYKPYKVNTTTKEEYLLILPVGTEEPVVHLNTLGGARYTQTIPVSPTEINYCYCITLVGLDLVLSSVTVTNWVYGEAVAGIYTTVTSYPTFRGPMNRTVTVYYDNGLNQTLTFNTRGETTVKPFGRTIVSILYNSKIYIPEPPIILSSMIVDLNYLLTDPL